MTYFAIVPVLEQGFELTDASTKGVKLDTFNVSCFGGEGARSTTAQVVTDFMGVTDATGLWIGQNLYRCQTPAHGRIELGELDSVVKRLRLTVFVTSGNLTKVKHFSDIAERDNWLGGYGYKIIVI